LRAERGRADYFTIGTDYFRTLRIPLIRGRGFLSTDNAQAPPIAVVDQAFVRRYFPNEEAVGKHLRLDTGPSDRSDWSEIVGVVGDVKDWQEDREGKVYEPYVQRPSSAMTLVIRTNSDPAAFAPILRGAVWGVDKDQPITHIQTMNQVIADYGAGGVTVCTMMGTFAGLALGMAVVGVFGVVAYTVSQRTNEIGIRMALGADKSDVLKMVVNKGVVLGTVGVGIGLALAAPLMWLRPGSASEDLMPLNLRISVLVAAAFLIGLAALLASYIPARRATKVDPIVALRHE